MTNCPTTSRRAQWRRAPTRGGSEGTTCRIRRCFGFVSIGTAVLLASLTGCLGLSNYQFGARTLFPENIETVYVPVFDSSSFRRELGEELTEAVVKEIERRSHYKVVASPSADTVLTGKITGEGKHLLFQNLTGDPREMEVDLKVKVSWVDRRGSPVREIPLVPVPGAAVDIDASSNMVAEVGHSVATSHQRAIQQLAEQIVSLMEKPW
jgi:hypothetical protein